MSSVSSRFQISITRSQQEEFGIGMAVPLFAAMHSDGPEDAPVASPEGGQDGLPNVPPIPADPTQAPGDGLEWRGKLPVGGDKGGWFNPETKETLHPDLNHENHGPHWNYIDPTKKGFRVYPDGRVEINPNRP